MSQFEAPTQLSGASRLFRDHLALELALLRESPDIAIHELDVFALFEGLFEVPPPGVNVSQGSQGRPGVDPDTYLWWDDVHPTTRGHHILAEAALRVITPSCGGSIPCACGQRVVRDRTLIEGVDPVTTTICPADGLIVASGVSLELGGTALRGQGLGAGVRIETRATPVTSNAASSVTSRRASSAKRRRPSTSHICASSRPQPGEHNRGVGISDDSAGTGTGGTANIYTGNLCGQRNGAAASSPARLCR